MTKSPRQWTHQR